MLKSNDPATVGAQNGGLGVGVGGGVSLRKGRCLFHSSSF